MIANLMAYFPILLCLLLGSGLIILEVFLPGFGLPGISGIALLAGGIIMIALQDGLLIAVAVLLVMIAVLALFISMVLRSATRGRMHHSELFLNEKEELHTGQDMQVLIGKKGMTTSQLRPAGIGDFDGVRLNVVTEGGFIERGVPIEIVNVEGTRIVVRAGECA